MAVGRHKYCSLWERGKAYQRYDVVEMPTGQTYRCVKANKFSQPGLNWDTWQRCDPPKPVRLEPRSVPTTHTHSAAPYRTKAMVAGRDY